MSGIKQIQTEQARQREIGWSAEHDRKHKPEEWAWLIEKRLLEIRDPWRDAAQEDAESSPEDYKPPTPISALFAQIGALAASALDGLSDPEGGDK